MALHTFMLQPSADLHLLPAVDVQVQVLGYDDAVSVTNPITSQCTFTIADTSIASVSAGGLVSALAAGITFLTVEHAASGNKLVARVWCHGTLNNIFLGNKTGRANVGSDNFQPTVYGDFDGGDLVDISGHPFVTYVNQSPALFSVDAVTGRVQGLAPGSGGLQIKNDTGTTVIGTLPITIYEPFGAARPLVERVTFKGNGAEKRNILFLAEGFAASEANRFKQIVRDLDQKMRTSPLHEPYRLLSDDYNTWLVFEESTTSGMSIGPQATQVDKNLHLFYLSDTAPATAGHYSLFDLIDLVGMATADAQDPAFNLAAALARWASIPGFVATNLEAGVFTQWKLYTTENMQTEVKDSAYGLMYGRRLGDNFAESGVTVHADNRWYRTQRYNAGYFYRDTRRIGTNHFINDNFNYSTTNPILGQYWTDEFFSYLNSLKHKGVPNTDPLYDIGQKWGFNGSDQGLVVVIVNDEMLGNNYQLMPNIFAAISTGVADGIALASMDTNPATGHTPNTANYFLAPLISRVLHELSHGIFLGDEYDDFRNTGHTTPSATTATELEIYHNNNSQPTITAGGLKWSKVFRISKSSAILTQVTISAAHVGTATLYPGEAAKWAVGEQVIIATKNMNYEGVYGRYQSFNHHPPVWAGPLTITAKAGDVLTMSGFPAGLPSDVIFPKGSIIFLPLIHNGQALSLVLPGVLDYMNNGTGNVPGSTFPGGTLRIARFLSDKGGNCAQADRGLPNTPFPIAHVNIARGRRHFLIGAHEGAGTYNCGVVRPAAVCKMRREYWYNGAARGHFRFCHVCRYYLVQEFNGSRHADLDALYPGSPI